MNHMWIWSCIKIGLWPWIKIMHHLTIDMDVAFGGSNAASAVNTILARWGKPAPASTWNTTGDLCSGWTIDDSIQMENRDFNPGIKCDCTYNNSKTCRIVKLWVDLTINFLFIYFKSLLTISFHFLKLL
jgi:hypothetical protein